MAKRIKKGVKNKVSERARFVCEYCLSQLDFSPISFSIEHIIPVAKNGSNDLDNLAFSCQGCNNRKYIATEAIDPVTNKIAPLYNPRKDRWSNHFQWNKSYSLILGISPTGRATISKLELNRDGVVNLRRVLTNAGEHPPRL